MSLHTPKYLCEQNAVKQLFCLRLILGDVGVGVHAEDVRVRIEWQLLDVF